MDAYEQEQADKQALRDFAVNTVPEPPAWEVPVHHLSPSSLNTFMRCPEQWRRAYVLKIKEPPSFAMALGTANHKAYGHNYEQKITSGKDLHVKEIVDYYHDQAVPETVEENGGETWIKDYDDNKMHRTGALMVEQYHVHAAPHVKPTLVEQKHTIRIPNVKVPVTGYVDVETSDSVIDIKTASRKTTKITGGWVIQGRIYQLFRDRPVEWHVVTSTARPEVLTPVNTPTLLQDANDETTDHHTMSMIKTLADQIEHLYTTVGPDDVWPMTGMMSKSCGWCGYKSSCPSGKWMPGAH